MRRVIEFRNAKVIKENLPEWLPFIERHYGAFLEEVRNNLLTIGTSTMRRYFKRAREIGGQELSTTRPSSILHTEIPICTASFWDPTVPGKMAADTVAHCGNTTEEQYINSLDMVDPVTHWSAQRAVWGKGSMGVLEATKDIKKFLPFPTTGLHQAQAITYMKLAEAPVGLLTNSNVKLLKDGVRRRFPFPSLSSLLFLYNYPSRERERHSEKCCTISDTSQTKTLRVQHLFDCMVMSASI